MERDLIDSLRDEGFLKREITKAIQRCEEHFAKKIPPGVATDLDNRRQGLMLIAYAIVRFSIQRVDLTASNRSEENRKESISMIQKIILKNLKKSSRCEEILRDVSNSRSIKDIPLGRLFNLFKLVGIAENSDSAIEFLPFSEWIETEVENFIGIIKNDAQQESSSSNLELELILSTIPKPLKKRPKKRIGPSKSESSIESQTRSEFVQSHI
jgi:hypothetical protein